MISEETKNFEFKSTKWHTTVKLMPEKIVSVSDKWGLGFDTSNVELQKDEARETLQVQTTFGWGARSNFQSAAIWGVAYLACHYLFQNWVTHMRWLALLGLTSAMIAGITKLKKMTWLSILHSNGSRAITFAIPSKNEKGIEEFKKAYSEYKRKVEPGSSHNVGKRPPLS